ncbi:MAG TPA: hypothetical protein VLD40_05920, partial [Dissulfurispiraceae bacterium]|nr:hypothetical protein [Dissulfurispiraceae bacterium]
LWSVANVDKMEGNYGDARTTLRAALKNFRRTRDPRGIIYCELTLGEIDALESRQGAAEKRFRISLDSAVRHRFRLEACHARALLALLRRGPGKAGRLPAPLVTCYASVGGSLDGLSIPVQMP